MTSPNLTQKQTSDKKVNWKTTKCVSQRPAEKGKQYRFFRHVLRPGAHIYNYIINAPCHPSKPQCKLSEKNLPHVK